MEVDERGRGAVQFIKAVTNAEGEPVAVGERLLQAGEVAGAANRIHDNQASLPTLDRRAPPNQLRNPEVGPELGLANRADRVWQGSAGFGRAM